MKHFAHALFTSLPFAARGTWLTMLMRVGTSWAVQNTLNLFSLLGNETWHLCTSRILFYTFVLSAPLGPAKSKARTGAAMAIV